MVVCGLMGLAGCKTVSTEEEQLYGAPGAIGANGAAAGADAVNVGFLLTMTYDEAKRLSPKSMVIPPFYKVAADEITVEKQDAAGQPLRVRAKGRVYLQIDFRENLQALGQEALIEAGGEIIVRGKPLLKRGRSVVEGLADETVYYIRNTRLQVIGRHRIVKQEGQVETPSGATAPRFNVLPTWQRSWQEGPNPLLPALSPNDVPQGMRASPLLPMPEGTDDLPTPMTPGGGPAPGSPAAERERSLGRKTPQPGPAEEAPAEPERGLGRRPGSAEPESDSTVPRLREPAVDLLKPN